MRTGFCAAVFVALIMLAAPVADGKRTLRRNLEPVAAEPYCGMPVKVKSGMLEVSGYDKPLRSRYETVFVKNCTDSTITSLRLHIRYTDMERNTIHEVVRRFECNIPMRSTRRITFSSWDKQQTLYYYRTDKPSRLKGTPYKVYLTPLEITVQLPDTIESYDYDTISIKHR